MCQSTFRIELPSSFAVMKDGSPAYGDAVCGEFFPPCDDVVQCPECQQVEDTFYEQEAEAAYQRYLDEAAADHAKYGGEDDPQPGNPAYNAGF